MKRTLLYLLVALSCLLPWRATDADIIEYNIPGTNLVVTLKGEYKQAPGGNAFISHPTFKESLIVSLSDIQEHYKLPSDSDLYSRQFRKIKDAQSAMAAADFALKHGMVEKVYECAARALEYDSANIGAIKALELQKKIAAVDFGESKPEEQALRDMVRMPNMKVALSKHFILLHDTPDTIDAMKKSRRTRAEHRLDLLERVYESFLLKFYSKGIELEIPQERLKVVLFRNKEDYDRFAQKLDPSLASAIGFYTPKENISFFFDHGTSEEYKELGELLGVLQERAEEAKQLKAANASDIIRFSKTLTLLVEIDRENNDIEVVSHECTHQMAGNTGLFPRHIMTPSWVHEGLATYFEAPKDASWSGIGAVNKMRLGLYRALAEQSPKYSHVNFIVSDEIFDLAGSHMSTLHGYSQAWGLTHFLIDRHFEEFMKFYKRLGEMPPDIVLSADVLLELFDECFESDRESLNREYHNYMATLKTEMEVVTGEEE